MSGKLSLMDPIVADKAKFEQALEDQACDVVDTMLAEGYVPDKNSIKIVCTNGNITLLHTLLSVKCDMNIRDGLFVAVENKQTHLLNYLYLAGVDLNLPNKDGSTLLHYVRDRETCKWLLDMGAQQTFNVNGVTPLHNACSGINSNNEEYFGIVKLLLSYDQGVHSISQVDNYQRTPLYWICFRSNPNIEIVKLLLSYDQGVHSISQVDNYQRTPLYLVCFRSNPNIEIVKLLLSYDQGVQSINMPCEKGMTPIHRACIYGQTEIVKLLLSYDQGVQSINRPCKNGMTPLHIACIYGNADIVRLLLTYDQGIQCLSKPDKYGRNPISCTKIQNVQAVIDEAISNFK